MKVPIPVLISLLVAGCGMEEVKQDHKEIKLTVLGRVLTLEEKKVVGTYKWKTGKDIIRLIFLESGIIESSSVLGEKEYKWEIRNNEIHAENKGGNGGCYRIESNGNLTKNAVIIHGKRTDLAKGEQMTFKKIR